MLIPRKHRTLFILISVSLAVILMAASLSNLEFRLGRFVTVERAESELDRTSSPGLSFILLFIRISLYVCLALTPLAVIYILISPQVRRQILAFFGFYLAIILIGHLFLRNLQFKAPIISKGETSIPTPPEWLVFMFSLGMSSFILGAFLFLLRRLLQRHHPKPIEVVAQEAQRTIEELRGGADLKEEVVRCYFEMNQVLSKQLGLKRKRTMTTREFENYLQDEGLPDMYIRRLTRLFEKVRYGAKNLGEPENREAIACLTAIVQACHGFH